jgi:hypothetical protein
MLGKLKPQEGDAAIVGTACHAGAHFAIECLLNEISEPDLTDALAAVHAELDYRWLQSGALHQVQISSLGEAHNLADQAFKVWWSSFLPDLDPDLIESVEAPFDVLAWREPKREVRLTGTMDLRFLDGSVVDWKFPGDSYGGSNAWKHERYDNQPTHYLWASLLLNGDNPLLDPDMRAELPDFTYGVVIRGKGLAEELDIKRTVGDVQFYRTEITALCDLIEQRLDHWPLNPTDWWCSDKWCPAWDQCRGQYLAPDPFGLMAKVAQLTGKHVPTLHVVPSDEEEGDPFEGLPNEETAYPQ